MELYDYINRAEFIWRYLKTIVWYKLFLKKCGRKSVIYKPIHIDPGCMSLGNGVLIRNNARIEAVSFGGTADIIIEDNVNIEQNIHMTCGNKIFIGKNTAIAANVTITDIKHNYRDVSLSPKLQPLEVSDVFIGQDCTIYNNAVILPGTVLGKHCTVAANAVVIGKTYADFSVLAGNPAKVISYYDDSLGTWSKQSN
jgi:acetyltransferase-like isoleucine patch superfamily enzyme